ncbi:MAG TPA: hypothetical protein VHM91_14375 [Verrucomicrobiales bacterium]|nr:hypothetical protein [Verrucomicrobiales bacterium]
MKCRYLLSVLFAGMLLFPSCKEEASKSAASDVSAVHKWLTAYALDSGGKYPDDLNQLLTKNYGADEAVLKRVSANLIEYRGKGMTSSDDPDLLLIRYRVGGDKEFRMTVSGSGKTVPSSTPLPVSKTPPPIIPVG